MSVLFFVAILALYSRVFYYHDDYGYASWSYCLDAPLNSLWDFLKFHFLNVNGRITGTIFLATLLRFGLWIPRIAMSICVFVIFTYLFLFSACLNNKNIENYIPIFACIGLFSLELYSGCFFWYSAAFMYLIPTMFFLPCVHIQNKKSLQKTDIIPFYIFSTLAALGQAVITVGILGYSICFALYTKFYEKQGLRSIDIFLIIIVKI